KSRQGLDLVIENKEPSIRSGTLLPDAAAHHIARDAANWGGLREITFRRDEIPEVAIPGFRAVLQHHTVMGESRIGPIKVAEQRMVPEDHILPTGFHAQALHAGKVPDQHVRSADTQCAAVTVGRSG